MIGSTLGFYFARRFTAAMLIVFGTVFVLIYMLDFVELMRRAGDAVGAGAGTMAKLALYRTPATAEQVIPFGMLFGGMVSFIGLSRSPGKLSTWGVALGALGCLYVPTICLALFVHRHPG